MIAPAEVSVFSNNSTIDDSLILNLKEGSSLVLMTTASLKQGLSHQTAYEWYKVVDDKIEETPVSRSQNLSFHALYDNDTAGYFCVVLRGNSVLKTSVVQVNVKCKLISLCNN